MTIFKRSITAALAVVTVIAAGVVGTPAHAATCVNVPASTPGTNVTILGEVHRVPAVSNVSVCAGEAVIPFVFVATSGGTCTAACLAVGLTGSDVDSGGVTISYQLDGSPRSHAVDPDGIGGPGGVCLLGVGSPVAPRSGCLFAVEPDDLQETLGTVNQAIADAQQDVQDAVNGLPDPGPTVDQVEGAVQDAINGLPTPGAIVAAVLQIVQQVLDTIPDDPVGDALRIVQDAVDDLPDPAACESVPPMRDEWGNTVEFCDDPGAWTGIFVGRVCEQFCGDDGLDNLLTVVCRVADRAGLTCA